MNAVDQRESTNSLTFRQSRLHAEKRSIRFYLFEAFIASFILLADSPINEFSSNRTLYAHTMKKE